MIRIVIGAGIGAALGFLYASRVGCRTGACPITSNKWVSSLYGFFLGGLISSGIR